MVVIRCMSKFRLITNDTVISILNSVLERSEFQTLAKVKRVPWEHTNGRLKAAVTNLSNIHYTKTTTTTTATPSPKKLYEIQKRSRNRTKNKDVQAEMHHGNSSGCSCREKRHLC